MNLSRLTFESSALGTKVTLLIEGEPGTTGGNDSQIARPIAGRLEQALGALKKILERPAEAPEVPRRTPGSSGTSDGSRGSAQPRAEAARMG